MSSCRPRSSGAASIGLEALVLSSGGSERNCFVLDAFAGVLTSVDQSPGGHDMDRASEQLLQLGLQGRLLDEAGPVAHLDEYIEIAPRPCVATGDRPENAYCPRPMHRRQAIDLIAAAAELLEAWGRVGGSRVRLRSTPTLNLSTEIARSAQGLVLVNGRVTHTPQRRRNRTHRRRRRQSMSRRKNPIASVGRTVVGPFCLERQYEHVVSAGGAADGHGDSLACAWRIGVVAHR